MAFCVEADSSGILLDVYSLWILLVKTYSSFLFSRIPLDRAHILDEVAPLSDDEYSEDSFFTDIVLLNEFFKSY